MQCKGTTRKIQYKFIALNYQNGQSIHPIVLHEIVCFMGSIAYGWEKYSIFAQILLIGESLYTSLRKRKILRIKKPNPSVPNYLNVSKKVNIPN
jgi:hypothetical protein